MDGSFGNLRLIPADATTSADGSAELPAFPTPEPTTTAPLPDPFDLANRELIRPPTHRRTHRGLEPFSAAWFDELEQKRYARHGAWLPTALEFGRHPGESVLLIGPGLGSDAVRYIQQGTVVTIGTTPADHHRQSLRRQEYGVTPRAALEQLAGEGGIVPAIGGPGTVVLFDCNLLHGSAGNPTPWPRANLFVVYNSVLNALGEPSNGLSPRPRHLAEREVRPLGRG